MPDCADCAYMDPKNEGLGKEEGKFLCENKRLHGSYVYVSARRDACACPGFLEASWSRGSMDKDRWRKKSKEHGYYVVTAICEILGFEESSEVSVCFEFLRDCYMVCNPQYQPFIDEYEEIGPAIAESLKQDENAKAIAADLFRRNLFQMVRFAAGEEYDRACQEYLDMFAELKEMYPIQKERKPFNK